MKFRGMGATAIAVASIAVGAGLVGVAIASQRQASQPAIVVASPTLAATTTLPPGPASQAKAPTLPSSKPISIDIPSIGVHSEMHSVGQEADDSLEVPAGALYDQAAWYRHSPTPGAMGPAIVLGHVDSAANGPSVFFRLGELQAGDRVTIDRADGSTAVFVVDEVHSYAKDDFPTKVVYGDIDHAGLRILTCGGAFDDSTGHYLNNIVVFASLVESA
jgi:sortase (surface protein transpeptidase)